MQNLNEDVQIELLSYLFPSEIISLYDSCLPFQQMLNELSTHKGFAVHCSIAIDEVIIRWFREHHIQLHLLEEYFQRDSIQLWLRNGKIHRDNDLPAIIDGNVKYWRQNGLRHRDNDLPAEIWADGTQIWYQNDKVYRDNGLPAEIWAEGTPRWYQNGKPVFRNYI